jgi:hypothetical protein
VTYSSLLVKTLDEIMIVFGRRIVLWFGAATFDTVIEAREILLRSLRRLESGGSVFSSSHDDRTLSWGEVFWKGVSARGKTGAEKEGGDEQNAVVVRSYTVKRRWTLGYIYLYDGERTRGSRRVTAIMMDQVEAPPPRRKRGGTTQCQSRTEESESRRELGLGVPEAPSLRRLADD